MTEPPTDSTPAEAGADTHEGMAHVMPLGVLAAVFGALLVLTFLTVAATQIDLRPWNLWIAMGIASVKALLVALYFMHLRYDNPFFSLVFAVGLLFVMLFVSLTLLDTLEYQPEIRAYQEAQP